MTLCRFLALLSFLLLLSCKPLAPATRVPPPSAPAFHTLTLGLCEDYPKGARSLEAARRDLQACKDAGVGVLRIAFSWHDMEPREGEFDFSFWDDYVRLATNDFHIRLIPYICYTPRWAATDPGPDYWHSPPHNPDSFARFVHTLVLRYGPSGTNAIHSWELWNEPDNPAYWSGTRPQFAELLRAGSRAVRSADPSATVVFGGIAGTTDFLADLLDMPGIPQAVDVLNFHAYFETWHPDPLEQVVPYIHAVRDIARRHGNHLKLWMAEVGYSTFRRNAYVSEQYAAHLPFEHTAAYQAQVLKRMAILVASTGSVDLFAWYRINDLPSTVAVIGDVNNRHLGILDSQGNPKPALAALRDMSQLFSLPFVPADGTLHLAQPLPQGAQLHAFERADGSLLIAAWRSLPSATTQHANSDPHSLILPLNNRSALTIPLSRSTTSLQLLPPPR